MPETTRATPQPNAYVPSEPFWDGARAGKLMLQRCKDTGRCQFYPRPVSLFTGSRNIEWVEAGGGGTIYAMTVLRAAPKPLSERLPLPIVTIELDEGVQIVGNIIETPEERIAIGARVELAWDRLDDGTPYPAFRVPC